MKIILDTNVLISGIFYSGPPFQILQAIHQGKIQNILSPEIIEEYQNTLSRISLKFPQIHSQKQLQWIIHNSQICAIKKQNKPICEDPDDDKFILCALKAKVNIIINGDKHLITLDGYKNIKVMKPKNFVDTHLP